jgi:hypothetical protein
LTNLNPKEKTITNPTKLQTQNGKGWLLFVMEEHENGAINLDDEWEIQFRVHYFIFSCMI